MKLVITSVDYAPSELHEQLPLFIELVRELPGEDRPDYWLGKTKKPIRWIVDNIDREIKWVVLAARWQGTRIEPNVQHLPIGIAYVVDESQCNDASLDFKKCKYIAIGIAQETQGGEPPKPLDKIISGRIGRFFGMGKTT